MGEERSMEKGVRREKKIRQASRSRRGKRKASLTPSKEKSVLDASALKGPDRIALIHQLELDSR